MALGGSYQDLNIRTYTDVINHELQQNGSILRGCVTVEQAMGERRYFNKIGKSSSQIRTNRVEKIIHNDQTYERRLVTPTTIVGAEIIDKFDLHRYARSPQPELAQAIAMELGRRCDDIITTAIGGTAARELNGSTSNAAFDTANNQIAVNSNGMAGSTMSGNTSLHEGKLLQARVILESKFGIMNGEEIYVIGNAKQFGGLASRVLANAGAGFFQPNMPALSQPMLNMVLDKFLGFRYVTYEFTGSAASNDYVYVVPKSAIKFGVWDDLSISVDRLVDHVEQPIQLAAAMTVGAVRMYEEKVVRILCNQTLTYS